MSNENGPAKYTIKGKALICPICQGERFGTRRSLMNTAGMTFLGFEWANKEAENYICANCGYVFWFMPPDNFA